MENAKDVGLLSGMALRTADAADRPTIYREVYESELQRILANRPREPQALQLGTNEKFARFVRTTVGHRRRVLEVGCGFGATALRVAGDHNEVVAVDVAQVAIEVARSFAAGRPNLRFLTMSATRLEFPEASFEAAFSSDLIEHLHADDLPTHLREVHRVLGTKGIYIIKTPSELTGPHGSSDPNDQHSLHLKEYRYGTLLPLLISAGFKRLATPALSLRLASRIPGCSCCPARLNNLAEAIACLAPPYSGLRRRLARLLGVKHVLVIATKR